jgi:hypothetical protein
LPAAGGHAGSGTEHLVARLEQGAADDVQAVDAAVGDEHILGIVDGNGVPVAELGRDQIAQPRHAGGLEVMRLVLGNRPRHRGLHGVGRVEADIPLVETERIGDRIHHVADADDAREGNRVEVGGHGPA